ncbi:unnamed protein product [Meloidogyne enterolobii]|uniref:Uncharacterized protein n=1 Tax=Meloidogyne enterolobii TaxID=390850 RepID=A0ACB1B4C3_MELEN
MCLPVCGEATKIKFYILLIHLANTLVKSFLLYFPHPPSFLSTYSVTFLDDD